MIYLLPLLMGFLAVLQAGLNRKIALGWGWSGATALNATILFLLAWGVYLSGQIAGRLQFSEMRWWFVLPGICGISLVLGLPYAISRIGAMTSFMIVISAQLLGGALWDFAMEGQIFQWKKVIGAGLAFLGTWIAIT